MLVAGTVQPLCFPSLVVVGPIANVQGRHLKMGRRGVTPSQSSIVPAFWHISTAMMGAMGTWIHRCLRHHSGSNEATCSTLRSNPCTHHIDLQPPIPVS